jgi:hypothetical protein
MAVVLRREAQVLLCRLTFGSLREITFGGILPRLQPNVLSGDSAFRVTQRGTLVERRKVVRFVLRCPAVFEWIDEEGQVQVGAGFTRDLSAAGVFLLSTASPPTGTRIRIDVLLPVERPAEEGLKLSSDATVTRIEKGHESTGFAATSQFAFAGDVPSSGAPIGRAYGTQAR